MLLFLTKRGKANSKLGRRLWYNVLNKGSETRRFSRTCEAARLRGRGPKDNNTFLLAMLYEVHSVSLKASNVDTCCTTSKTPLLLRYVSPYYNVQCTTKIQPLYFDTTARTKLKIRRYTGPRSTKYYCPMQQTFTARKQKKPQKSCLLVS